MTLPFFFFRGGHQQHHCSLNFQIRTELEDMFTSTAALVKIAKFTSEKLSGVAKNSTAAGSVFVVALLNGNLETRRLSFTCVRN